MQVFSQAGTLVWAHDAHRIIRYNGYDVLAGRGNGQDRAKLVVKHGSLRSVRLEPRDPNDVVQINEQNRYHHSSTSKSHT